MDSFRVICIGLLMIAWMLSSSVLAQDMVFSGQSDCCDTPGDANDDGGCNTYDAGFLVNYMHYGGPPPPCMEEADFNGDDGVNIADVGNCVNYIFFDGPPPICGNSSVPGAGLFEPDPGIPDTITVETVESKIIAPGSSEFAVGIILYNDEELLGFDIPLIWDSPDIQIDSVSFIGSPAISWTVRFTRYDNALQQVHAGAMVSAGNEPPIQPGYGPIFTIYFSIDPEASIESFNIDSAFYPIADAFLLILNTWLTISPQFKPGLITLTNCETPGDANHDLVCNLADAGYIINYIFYEGPEPVCMEEGDANADGNVNLADAGYIINYIFYDGPDPVYP